MTLAMFMRSMPDRWQTLPVGSPGHRYRAVAVSASDAVATQLPIRLLTARAVPVTQWTKGTNARPIVSIAGTALWSRRGIEPRMLTSLAVWSPASRPASSRLEKNITRTYIVWRAPNDGATRKPQRCPKPLPIRLLFAVTSCYPCVATACYPSVPTSCYWARIEESQSLGPDLFSSRARACVRALRQGTLRRPTRPPALRHPAGGLVACIATQLAIKLPTARALMDYITRPE